MRSLLNPDMLFQDGGLEIKARMIKNYLASHPNLVILKASWPITPFTNAEINENSSHPLAALIKNIGPICFSIYRTSAMIEPIKDAEKTTKKVAQILFDWKNRREEESNKRQEKAAKFIKATLRF